MKIIPKNYSTDDNQNQVTKMFILGGEDAGLADGYDDYDLVAYGYESIIFSAINLIAKTVSMQKYKLYKNDKVVKDRNDLVFNILTRPNKYYDWHSFAYLLSTMYDIFGEVYIYLARDKLGVVRELYVIPSYAIEPVFDDRTKAKLLGFRKRYVDEDIEVDTDRIDFTPDEVIYDFIPNPEAPLRGLSPLSKVLNERDIHIFAKRYIRDFYKNGAVPFGVLYFEDKVSQRELDAFERSWKARYSGVGKKWELAIVSGKVGYIEMSAKPDKEFIEQSKWTVYDILSAFGVPPSLIFYTEGVNRTTAEVHERQFARDCIKPRLSKIESLINTKLIPAIVSNANYRIEFINPVPEDEKIAVQKAKVLATFGIATINEVRQLLGLEPLEDEIGNELITPLNMPHGRPSKEDKDIDERIVKEIAQLERFLKEVSNE